VRASPLLDDAAATEVLVDVQARVAGNAAWQGARDPAEAGHLLGEAYEAFLGGAARDARKAGGAFYTPRALVHFMVEEALGPLLARAADPDAALALRVVDPACGSGAFLLGAFDWLLGWHAARRGRALTSTETRDVLGCVWGVDCDPEAVAVTRRALLLRARAGPDADVQAALRVRVGDALDEPLVPGDRFDAVVGNPPYGASLSPERVARLVAAYPAFAGARDAYVCFVERGLDMLRTGGRLAFVLPSAWLGGPAYATLRRRVLAEQVERVVLLPFDVFGDAYVDTMVLVAARGAPRTGHHVLTYAYPKRAKLAVVTPPPEATERVPQAAWVAGEDQKFVVARESLGLLERVRAACPGVLAAVASMRRGVLARPGSLLPQGRERERARGRDGRDQVFPYFEGDVYRHELRFASSHSVRWDHGLAERPRDFRWFEGERVLLRRLVNRQGRLMAAVADGTFVTNKNLYTLIPDGNALDPWALAALLDSALLSYLYVAQIPQASKDDFPQVTIRDVLRLPIPADRALRAAAPDLAAAARRIAAAIARGDEAAADREDQTIERLVATAYDLGENDLRRLPPSAGRKRAGRRPSNRPTA
jgi:hypothetical protein